MINNYRLIRKGFVQFVWKTNRGRPDFVNNQKVFVSRLTFAEDVNVGGGVEDKIITAPLEDFKKVLENWQDIMKQHKKIGVKIFQHFLDEHPFYKNFFPRFATVRHEDLIKKEEFIIHSQAVLRGIDSVMNSLSGEFEEENELLQSVGLLHFKRGITANVMYHLKESLVLVCSDYLKLNRKDEAAWNVVMDYIFKEYLCKDMHRGKTKGRAN